MFGLMVCDGMEWYGMEWYCFPLFGFIKKERNGMELDGIDSILFHHLLLFCFPSNLEGMEWNGSLFQYNNNYITILTY
jgi:hypothetical protein